MNFTIYCSNGFEESFWADNIKKAKGYASKCLSHHRGTLLLYQCESDQTNKLIGKRECVFDQLTNLHKFTGWKK